jgi:hypothetical protein
MVFLMWSRREGERMGCGENYLGFNALSTGLEPILRLVGLHVGYGLVTKPGYCF